MSERDPRIDPRPGDELRLAWPTGNGMTAYAVHGRCGLRHRVVEAWLTHFGNRRTYACFDLADWKFKLKSATIIKRGDDTAPEDKR